jgi:NarL family two-component system sensor histidine kinase LiaS
MSHRHSATSRIFVASEKRSSDWRLATRAELAAVAERNRLARDLHDSIKQYVFAFALVAGAARSHLPSDTFPAQTSLVKALAEQTRQDLTALICELRPACLEDKGLEIVLREYAEDWSRRTGIAVAIQV